MARARRISFECEAFLSEKSCLRGEWFPPVLFHLIADAQSADKSGSIRMRLVVFGTIAAGVAGLAAYDKYDKSTNFQPVDARISAVSDQCYMEKSERGVLTKTTSTSDLIRCELAELLTREHPKWKGYAIKRKIEIRFAYV